MLYGWLDIIKCLFFISIGGKDDICVDPKITYCFILG